MMTLAPVVQAKYDHLRAIILEMESVIVGYSGGVDSALLSAVAHAVLGDRALAVTARSASLPERELREAIDVAALAGFRHQIIETDEVADGRYAANPVNRCYFCKSELFEKLEGIQQRSGYRWLAYGENVDDQTDHRPGGMAALEHRVRAPLKEAGLTKAEIRALSQHLDLPIWDKPALACLASRFPYGTTITAERLAQVESAENALWDLGFRQYRVRYHNEVARIEVERAEMARVLAVADEIASRLRQAGFTYVALDIQGYRRGSLNEANQVLISADLPVV